MPALLASNAGEGPGGIVPGTSETLSKKYEEARAMLIKRPTTNKTSEEDHTRCKKRPDPVLGAH
jgi:hypothetical protein